MNPGDVALIPLPQLGGGSPKLRPALILAQLPGPYQDLLVCGISTQLNAIQTNWDELLQASDADFAASGLHQDSVVRLSYLSAVQSSDFSGVIGQIDAQRLVRLLTRLADHLRL